MAVTPVTLSVAAAALTTTYTINTRHPSNETAATAINIGNLQQQGEALTVSDNGTQDGVQTYNFTLQAGDNAVMQASFNNIIDQIATHVQLYDANGALIADNQGTTAQQTAYTKFISNGLVPGAGNYSLQVTPPAETDPPKIQINALAQQGTSLSVASSLNSGEPSEYYNFSLNNSNNIKLNFDNLSSGTSAHIQLYSSTGALVADNQGNSFQRSQYAALASGTGLSAVSGNYSVKVSYANGADTSKDLKYNFQLYSGSNYAVNYQTNVTTPAAKSGAAASVTATADAKLFARTDYNSVDASATSSINVGWLQQNKTSLDVYGRLTAFDSADYYNFTLQKGNNIKLGLTNITKATDTTSLRVQLLDSTGTKILADNQGTVAQQQAYNQLTSSKGLTEAPAGYVVKVTYGPHASKTHNLDYNFKIFSGTSYSASYRTTASAQTYENAVLSGSIGTGTTANSAIASYLTSVSNGTTPGLFGNSTTA